MIYYVMKLYLMSCVGFFITQVEKRLWKILSKVLVPLLRAILVKPWTSGMMSGCQ